VTIARFVKVVRTAVSTTRRVLTAQFRGYGSSESDATAENIDGADTAGSGAELVQPLGLVARPVLTSHTEALVVELRDGDEVIAIAVVDKSRAALTVEEGGVRLVGAGPDNTTAAGVYIRAAGKVEIDSEVGEDIVLNAGTLAVARFSDTVSKSSDLALWMTQVEGVCNGVVPFSVAPLSPTFVTVGTISSGATRVKA